MAKELVLLRHADIGRGYTGRLVGSTDVPLSVLGRKQAALVAAAARERAAGRCFCSPQRRALETSEVAGISAEVDQDLREVDFGRWEGKTFDEAAASDPELVGSWSAFDQDFAFPDGESIGDFLARVRRAADRMVAEASEVVLAVTHAGVIRAVICYLLGLQPWQYVLFDVRPASLTTIQVFAGKGVLTGLNDVCHLKGL